MSRWDSSTVLASTVTRSVDHFSQPLGDRARDAARPAEPGRGVHDHGGSHGQVTSSVLTLSDFAGFSVSSKS